MTTISPTRVSMYDFLYQDTQPLVSLLADTAQLSLPQTRIALTASLQAIVAALLSYQQQHQGQAVHKKLFTRGAIKELRQYNSMNFATLKSILYYRNEVGAAVFGDNARVLKASEYIATQVHTSAAQIQILLSALCVVVLRELAIVADYGKLDHDELDKWFALQPQFLAAARFKNQHTEDAALNQPHLIAEQTETALPADSSVTPPPFDAYWYELTHFKPEQVVPVQDMQQATPNYLKAIGRSPDNIQQGAHNDILVFAMMPNIALPHQRWLLQLAKIADIYLSRNRLRINSEPDKPPTAPLVNLGLIGSHDERTPTTISEKPIEYDTPRPLWRDPVILIIIAVIGLLSALAVLKYQLKQADNEPKAPEVTVIDEAVRAQQDVAIVKVEDDEDMATTENTP